MHGSCVVLRHRCYSYFARSHQHRHGCTAITAGCNIQGAYISTAEQWHTHKHTHRDKQTDRDTQTDRHTKRHTERHTERHAERHTEETHRGNAQSRHKHRDTQGHKDRGTKTDTQTITPTERHTTDQEAKDRTCPNNVVAVITRSPALPLLSYTAECCSNTVQNNQSGLMCGAAAPGAHFICKVTSASMRWYCYSYRQHILRIQRHRSVAAGTQIDIQR